jgi:fructose-1,6-bisphosphatase
LFSVTGGRAIWSKGKRVLEIVPTAIHERTPIFLGGSKSMDILEKFLK